jgi:imidazolonepropionase-like amidohydrolase
MDMLPGEVLNGLTLNAAAALRRADRLGSLAPGKQADLVVCSVSDYREQSARWAALAVWHFLAGLAERVRGGRCRNASQSAS